MIKTIAAPLPHHTYHLHILNARQEALRVRFFLHEHLVDDAANVLGGGTGDCLTGRIEQLLAGPAQEALEAGNDKRGWLKRAPVRSMSFAQLPLARPY